MAVITGTEGNDFIVSFNGLAQDTVLGLAGNDTLEADQSDFLDGGLGDDRLRARNDSTLLGGEGNDTLLGFGIYDATLDGGAGDDLIDPRSGGGYKSLILGGSGNDTLLLAGWDQTIDAGDGTDVIDLGASEGSASVTSGTGADIIKLGFWLAPTTITDFDLATGGDRIDLLGLYLELRSDYGFDMCDPFAEGWLQLVQDGDDTLLQVSLQGDGSGWIPLVKFQNLVATELDREIHFGIPQGGAAVSITGTSSSETFDEFTPYNGLVPGMLADTINGLGGADLISGGLGGADLLIGGNGIDSLFGFAGNDTLYGGQPGSTLSTHADFISGGGGDDLIYGSSGHDGEFDFTYQGFRYIGGLNGDGGNDTIYGGAGNDIAGGGDGDDSLFGEAGNDIIGGGAGADYLDGGEGDDNITGSVGLDDMAVDTVLGGVGNDTLWGESLDLLDGGEGNDQLNINGDSATAFGGLGNDSLASQKASLLDGGDGDDMLLCYRDGTMLGGNGADWLRTNGGVPYANFLDGGTGDDTMEGGRGDDTYVIDSAGDIITEYVNGGEDTVITALAMTLGSELEHLLLTGPADLNAAGNTKDNHLTGNDGNNLIEGLEGNDTLGGGAGDDALNGGAGNDTLTGSAGTDTLIGGAGNDTYAVYGSDDVAVELADEGIDTLLVTRSAELSGALSHIENIQLMGKGNFSATGNDVANLLQGNTGANLLAGLAGNDTLRGGGGFDTFVGGAGDDFFSAQGADFEVIEHDGEGVDTLSVRFTATLSANLEKLVLGGSAAIDGTGNALRNVLLGNDAANTLAGMNGDDLLNGRAGNDALDGGLGNDTLDGGAGADTAMGGLGDDLYYVEEDGDVVVELADEGFDVVISTVSMSIMANVETLRFNGWNDAEGFGNDEANIIAGNNSFNRLEGGAGNDTLSGNGLDDTLIGGTGDDLMRGGSGSDVYYVDSVDDRVIESVDHEDDLVISTVSWTLGNHVENLTLSGSADLLGTGNKLHNVLTGNSGNNLLSGGKGMDTLAGGAGVDTLVGGRGFDVFVIHRSDVEAGDVDLLVDMTSGVDALQLNGFGLGEGEYSSWLAEEAFLIGEEAQTAEQRIVYDEALGSLYYDADGNGSEQAILVASLGNGVELQYYDIRVLD